MFSTILISILLSVSAASNKAVTITTTADSTKTFSLKSVSPVKGNAQAATTIELDPSQRYQTMDGFGFALTYSTAYNLKKMPAADRKAFLTRTFSKTQGYGVSYLRMSIGCSDFSSTEYTLCDTEGLEHFSLQNDETEYVLPMLKEIVAINPQIKIIASPWTCPKWMKVGDDLTGTHDSWTDGRLNPDMRTTYAEYFVRFIKAMNKEGFDIYAVTPQNEPLNKGNCASLYMPWEDEAPFVRCLAEAFHNAGITSKIYLYDHNYDYSGITSQQDYPVNIFRTLGTKFPGANLVVGSAWHDYGGQNTTLNDVYSKAPNKEIIFSEASIGTWNNGNQLAYTLIPEMRDMVIGTINKMCRAVIVWNLMLDDRRGPNLDGGGCQTCYGAVDINSANYAYSSLKYNGHYFVICHAAAVVQPGAVRIGSKQDAAVGDLVHSEFVNPDGSYASLLCNTGKTVVKVILSDGSKRFPITVPANSVVSVKWAK